MRSRRQDPLYVEDEVPIRDEVARRYRVESVTGHTYPMIGGRVSANGYKSHFLAYDGGRRVVQECFNPDGNVVRRWVYDDGNSKQEFLYDRFGNLDSRFDIFYLGDYWNEKQMYDAQGTLKYRIVGDRLIDDRLSKATFYAASGELIRSDFYLYDRVGLLLRVNIGQIGQRLFNYDQNDNVIKRSTSLPGASIFGDVDEFDYDNRGLVSRKTHLHDCATLFDWACLNE